MYLDILQLGGNTLPLQTLLQSGQTLAGQTLYGGQGGGLFPAQGSVHIENPKVVNVNFGPHVIGSDGSGQQTIFQVSCDVRITDGCVICYYHFQVPCQLAWSVMRLQTCRLQQYV